jgi:hypothetical protein
VGAGRATIVKVTGRGLIVAIYAVGVATRAVNDDDAMKNRVSTVSPYLINRSEASPTIEISMEFKPFWHSVKINIFNEMAIGIL